MSSWTDLTFAFESVLTSVKMGQLQANLHALAEGSAGAPTIASAASINANTVTGSTSSAGAVWDIGAVTSGDIFILDVYFSVHGTGTKSYCVGNISAVNTWTIYGDRTTAEVDLGPSAAAANTYIGGLTCVCVAGSTTTDFQIAFGTGISGLSSMTYAISYRVTFLKKH